MVITCIDLQARAEPDVATRRIEELRQALNDESPDAIARCMDDAYLRLVPAADMVRWAARVAASCGEIDRFEVRRRDGAWHATFEFITTRGYVIPVALEIDPEPPNKIHHARLWDPCPYYRSRSEVKTAVGRLGESAALYAAEMTEDGLRPWLEIGATRMLSVASAMKLYLLAGVATEIADHRHMWQDSVELRDADRSLSSGVMHNWPTGTGLSLQACGALMIAESDNTAADLILHTIGRDRVEMILDRCGHSDPSRTIPYLSTAEMFKLKYHNGGVLGDAYARLERSRRLGYLQTAVASVGVGELLTPDTPTPTLVNDVGWFASAKDLAEVVRHLWILSGKNPEGTPLAILGIKGADALPGAFFDYSGVMVGRDAGVRAIACVVSLQGRWHVLTCVVNDSRKDPSEAGFRAIACGVLCRGEEGLSE